MIHLGSANGGEEIASTDVVRGARRWSIKSARRVPVGRIAVGCGLLSHFYVIEL